MIPPPSGEVEGAPNPLPSPAQLKDSWEWRLGATREVTRVAGDLLGTLARAFHASRGSLMIVNPRTGRLRIVAAVGLPAAVVGLDLVPAPRRISDWVFREHKAVVVNGEVSDQRFEGSAVLDRIASAISIPLPGPRGAIGVLNLARVIPSGVFDDSDLAAIESMIAGAAELLERAQELDTVVASWRAIRLGDGGAPHGWGGTRSCQIAAARIESIEFSGDFFDRVAHPDGGLTLILGDVFRIGVGALRSAALIRGLFLAHARYHRSPAEIMRRIHDALVQHHPQDCASLWIATISPSGQLTCCSAGQPPAICLPTDGVAGQRLTAGGPPVGAVDGPFPYEQDRIRLLPGDAIVAVSNGLLGVPNGNGEVFGVVRVEDCLHQNRRQDLEHLVGHLCEEAVAFGGPSRPVDDVLGLALRFSRED